MRQRKILATRAEYIDPLNAGSVVDYEIHRSRRGQTIASVDLTDCNRKIQWWFYLDDNDGLMKATLLLNFFTDFAMNLEKYRQKYRQKRSRKKKRS